MRKEQTMTNFENITQSPEYLAYVITSLIHEVEMSCVRKMEDAGVKCDLYELDTDLQAQVHLAWLESEVDANDR
jgi:hypothetical protein